LRRDGFRRALIGERALDDLPIDAPRAALSQRFAFGRRRCRDIFVPAIDDRFEGVELWRRLVVAPIAAAAAIAVSAFAKGLAALAVPRSPIAIAPLAITRRTVTRLALTRLPFARLTITRLAVAALAPRLAIPSRAAFAARLTVTATFAALALAARAIAIATPTRTTLAALLLRTGFTCRSHAFTRGRCTFGMGTTAATTATARTLADRQGRQAELAARRNRLDTNASRPSGLGRLRAFGRRSFTHCRRGFASSSVRRRTFGLRPRTTAATPASARLLRITRKMQCARCVVRQRSALGRRRGFARVNILTRRSRRGRGRCFAVWLRRSRRRARIFIIPDHGIET
jgi:hypothetical protein